MPYKTLILACGALGKEIVTLKMGLGDLGAAMDIQCLPADYHNRPEKIVPALKVILDARGQDYDRVLIGYGDCGTGGGIDRLLENYAHAERLPGAHCYAFYTGLTHFDDLMDEAPGTFFLTDYLVRQFDSLVMKGLGLDRFPELRDSYFGNYTRLVYVSQIPDAHLLDAAEQAARTLGLDFIHRPVGYGELATTLTAYAHTDRASVSHP